VVGGELPDHQASAGVLKSTDVTRDFSRRVKHIVHVHAKDDISIGIAVQDIARAVAHDKFPVLSPIGSVHHERVAHSRVSQCGDGGDVVVDVGIRRHIVAEGFVGNVDDDAGFLPVYDVADFG
jgi:hypothetical protein